MGESAAASLSSCHSSSGGRETGSGGGAATAGGEGGEGGGSAGAALSCTAEAAGVVVGARPLASGGKTSGGRGAGGAAVGGCETRGFASGVALIGTDVPCGGASGSAVPFDFSLRALSLRACAMFV